VETFSKREVRGAVYSRKERAVFVKGSQGVEDIWGKVVNFLIRKEG
jgi:hypothetical protein